MRLDHFQRWHPTVPSSIAAIYLVQTEARETSCARTRSPVLSSCSVCAEVIYWNCFTGTTLVLSPHSKGGMDPASYEWPSGISRWSSATPSARHCSSALIGAVCEQFCHARRSLSNSCGRSIGGKRLALHRQLRRKTLTGKEDQSFDRSGSARDVKANA